MSVLQSRQILINQKPVLLTRNSLGLPLWLVISLLSIIFKHLEGSCEIKLKSALVLTNNSGKQLTLLANLKFGCSPWVFTTGAVFLSTDNQQFTAFYTADAAGTFF